MIHNKPGILKTNKYWYLYIHNWIKKYKPMPRKCEDCGQKRLLQYANLSGRYKKQISDWKCLCIICHRAYDEKSTSLLIKKGMPFLIQNTQQAKKFLKKKYTSEYNQKYNHFERNFSMLIDWTINRLTLREIAQKNNLKSCERVRQINYKLLYFLSRQKSEEVKTKLYE